MREILFRGKRADNGQWVYGYVIECGGRCFIVDKDNKSALRSFTTHCSDKYDWRSVEVMPETVGQYTGLKDKNGKKIFEEDICKYYNALDKDGIGVIRSDYVIWVNGTIAKTEFRTPLYYLKCSSEWEIIGNNYDNPELLEG